MQPKNIASILSIYIICLISFFLPPFSLYLFSINYFEQLRQTFAVSIYFIYWAFYYSRRLLIVLKKCDFVII